LLCVPQRLRQKTARPWCVAEFPIRRGQLDRKLRPVADAHEERCGMVGIGFRPGSSSGADSTWNSGMATQSSGPLLKITDRSITFCNSRMLPGRRVF
jgi:hypothetical protein